MVCSVRTSFARIVSIVRAGERDLVDVNAVEAPPPPNVFVNTIFFLIRKLKPSQDSRPSAGYGYDLIMIMIMISFCPCFGFWPTLGE